MTDTSTELRRRAYTLKEVAELTGLSVPYLRLQMVKGLKVTRFGRSIRVLDHDLDRFLQQGVCEAQEAK